MLKRGKNRFAQVTVFIIIAVVIIGAVITALAFRNKINFSGTGSSNINPEVKQIDDSIKECAKQRTIDAIRIIGLQGGYVNLPENYLKTNISNIAYGYYNGKNTLASRQTMENEINYYVELTMPFCIEDTDFPQLNLTIGKAKSQTKIENNQVFVTLKLPISISKDEKTILVEEPYKVQIPIRLWDMYSIAGLIIKKEIDNPEKIELSELSKLDYYITLVPVDNDNIVYIITDKKSSIESISYSFLFANKFKR